MPNVGDLNIEMNVLLVLYYWLDALNFQLLLRLGLAWLGLAWLGLAWLGLAWLGRHYLVSF
jgi:hypothetical protein